ncbi:unnamed protein product [Gongylonema pulchrum]|uniref:Uncharacterized protein n=1 Tax=Gongylonema pulchrum TaxID=637853 RepID=A0A183DAM9_9BILA|nr:unnamed protein product [Gongylonema pulchrum]
MGNGRHQHNAIAATTQNYHDERFFKTGHLSAGTKAPVDRWKTATGCSEKLIDASEAAAAAAAADERTPPLPQLLAAANERGISPGSSIGVAAVFDELGVA